MAEAIDGWAIDLGLHAASIDGPQGWRDPHAAPRPGVGRRCEHEARTPGKTGTFGNSYPRNWLGWIRLSMEVFDHLRRLGHVHVANEVGAKALPLLSPGHYHLLERRACDR